MERVSSEMEILVPTGLQPKLSSLQAALELGELLETLNSVLARLDDLGTDIAAAHLARAISALRDRSPTSHNAAKSDAPA